VREVAVYLTLAQMGLRLALDGILRARGSFDGMIRDTAMRQARQPVEDYPRLLRAMRGSRRQRRSSPTDVLVRAQDFARPRGLHYPTPTGPAIAAADRVWSTGFPFRARQRLSGYELVATDASWRVGSGRRVEGPITALLLLLVNGRSAALTDLSGLGAADLAASLPWARDRRPHRADAGRDERRSPGDRSGLERR
jgi:hypothetical protein